MKFRTELFYESEKEVNLEGEALLASGGCLFSVLQALVLGLKWRTRSSWRYIVHVHPPASSIYFLSVAGRPTIRGKLG